MKTKYSITLILIFLLSINLVNAQFPGKRSKADFTAIDSVTYKVGDIITFGQPMKGDKYAAITSFKRKTFLDNVSDVTGTLAGENIKSTEFNLSPKELRNKQDARIKFFKILKSKDGIVTQYAIVPYTTEIYLAIPINIALSLGELNSKNPNYISSVEIETKEQDTYVKSFSPNFEIKLLSVIGNKNNQTVEIELLLKHKIVHQKVCFNYGKNDAKLYDFEGNEYLAKGVEVGAINKTSGFGNFACNKIPTNVPVKGKIIFKQVLSDKSKMSFSTIKVGFKADDGGSYEYGTIELTNLNVDWK
ncbi:hypothetical protein FEZ18_07400 [Oceanihabitans sp. IOP_32]|uniref:hypothetical protein n=1 Tax=Oceanihabitans sp. IOP_32 TaxID=2529032 RepID=UPI001292FF9D|nr:hypothetical protein [Oceanihabitans sp. IOP_32]QFZ54628.1 hypothetical protein FEZ18_07400 [Oceanihabitans sp. IOP_32]